MFFSSRVKVNIILPLVSILALVVAFFPGQVTYAASIATNSSSSYQVTREATVKVGTADLMKLPTAKVDASAGSYAFPHPSLYLNREAGPLNLPQLMNAAPGGLNNQPPPPPPPVQNWNGVSSSDSIKATGYQVQPPDQGLCVSKNYVVEPVNWAMSIYSHDGGGKRLSGPVSLQSLFLEPLPPKALISDPECYFDTTTNAWFDVVSAIVPGKHPTTHLDIAVNTSGNPINPWTVYILDTTDKSRSGCPCFADQPRLGIDQNNLYIDTDEFTLSKGNFLDAEIYAFSKSQLVALSRSVNTILFYNLSIAGQAAFAVQPAVTTGSPKAEYFLSSFVSAGSDNRLGVWALTNGQAVTNGGTVILSNLVTTLQFSYSQPPPALNPNSNQLESDDDRMQQVQFINNEIWGSLDTAGTPSGDTAVRAGVEWFIVDPVLSSDGTKIQSAALRDQGALGAVGNYLLYPAIQAGANGGAVMVVTVSGPKITPTAAYLQRLPIKQGEFSVFRGIALGANAYNCATQTGVLCRWGDYSAAVIDPANTGGAATFWIATEYIPDTGSEIPNWGTEIAEVLAS